VDLDLCQRALRLNPDLWVAAQIVSKANERAAYPIKSLDDLCAAVLKSAKGGVRFEGMTLTAANARAFFPRVFFPIEGEDELLKAVYAALVWAREVHLSEDRLRAHKASL
jgi:hypothetical protein